MTEITAQGATTQPLPSWMWRVRILVILSSLACLEKIIGGGGFTDSVPPIFFLSLPYLAVFAGSYSRKHASGFLGFLAGWNGAFLVVMGWHHATINTSTEAVLFSVVQVAGIVAAFAGLVGLCRGLMPIVRFAGGAVGAVALWAPYIMGLGEAFGSSP